MFYSKVKNSKLQKTINKFLVNNKQNLINKKKKENWQDRQQNKNKIKIEDYYMIRYYTDHMDKAWKLEIMSLLQL